MSAPVEAQSLSSLNSLFANPPQYPRNPTHHVHEPLVLYIVRVPGSKDVFLTPLKPPTKASISLEAIQSSLYYLHVSSEEDEEVKRSIDEERRSHDLPSSESHVVRKPLPPTPYANYPAYERPLPPPKSYPSYQPGLDGDPDALQSERYTARGSHLRFGGELRARDPNVIGRTVRPDSFHQGPQLHVDSSVPSHAWTQHRPRSSDSIAENCSIASLNQGTELRGTLGGRAEKCTAPIARDPMITLIRRDPVSGGQWNVGLISQLEPNERGLTPHPMVVELTTPGYGRFSHSLDIPDAKMMPTSAEPVTGALAGRDHPSLDSFESSPVPLPFTRTIDFREHEVGVRRTEFHQRTQSWNSLTSSSPTPSKPPRHVYSFLSPWKGICTFNRGIDSRSLKCHHTLSSVLNTEEDSSMEVAELRFNLPRSTMAPADADTEKADTLPISELVGPRSGKEAIRRSIQQFKNMRLDKLSKDHEKADTMQERSMLVAESRHLQPDPDRISLKLGREKAGGGFRGTSAKLGKLIVSDEGLKMCDLVVAACMGVWWQHYEPKT